MVSSPESMASFVSSLDSVELCAAQGAGHAAGYVFPVRWKLLLEDIGSLDLLQELLCVASAESVNCFSSDPIYSWAAWCALFALFIDYAEACARVFTWAPPVYLLLGVKQCWWWTIKEQIPSLGNDFVQVQISWEELCIVVLFRCWRFLCALLWSFSRLTFLVPLPS